MYLKNPVIRITDDAWRLNVIKGGRWKMKFCYNFIVIYELLLFVTNVYQTKLDHLKIHAKSIRAWFLVIVKYIK